LAFCILGEDELVKSLLFLLASYDLISKEDMNLLQKQISANRRAHLIKLLLSWVLSVTTINQLKQFVSRKPEFENQLKELIKRGKGFPEIQEKQQMKIKGLYADVKDGKITSPFEITEKNSSEALSKLRKSLEDIKKYAEIIENQPIARKILTLVFQMGFDFAKTL